MAPNFFLTLHVFSTKESAMSASETSFPTDFIGRRLALVRDLRERFLDEQDHERPAILDAIGCNLWLFGPDFDARPFKSDERITVEGSSCFSPPPQRLTESSTWSQVCVDFRALRRSNPYDSDYGVSQLVIVAIPPFDSCSGHQEHSMIWQCAKHLRLKGRIREDARVTGFILSHLFEPYEHESSQYGGHTSVQPRYIHMMLDAAEHRLSHMR
ncbi:hypothetical protein ACNI65_22920 [Roseateles sp. So40a]|uniref:hypothetical protein n=1 Tax=Roseateles sp. So40a TaxID=3400226 RepID=UPI003A8684DC